MNRQKLIIELVLLLTFTYVKGQDKIITTQNDTISCRIISISLTHIQYEQKGDNQDVIGRFIPIEQVLEYSHNSYGQETPWNSSKTEPFQRWRIGLQGGGARLLSSFTGSKSSMQDMGIPQSRIDDYHKQLRNGINVGADIHYMITPFLGVGANYSLFSTTIQMNYNIRSDYFYDYSSYNIPIYYSMGEKDKIYVNYIGPSIAFQHWIDKSHQLRLNEELTIGYARYREEQRLDPYRYVYGYPMINPTGYNFLAEGNTWGGNIRVSFEYYPLSWVSVGVNAGFFTATFKTLNLSNRDTSIEQKLERANYLNMSRLDYSIGIRFHFK